MKRTTDQSIPDATVTAVAWQAAQFDDGAMWSAGDPTRLTVPAGVSKVRLTASLRWTKQATGDREAILYANGARMTTGGTFSRVDAGSVAGWAVQHLLTGVLEVTPGTISR